MRKKLAFAVIAAACIQANSAGALQKKRDFDFERYQEPVKKTEHVTCRLEGANKVTLRRGSESRSFTTYQPIYEGKETPLSISCNSNRAVVLTTEKIAILPGFEDAGKVDETGAMLVQKLKGKGLKSWKISGDDVYYITGDNSFWTTNINELQSTSYRIPELQNSSRKKIFVHRDIVFIAQQKKDGKQFMVAIKLDDGAFIKKSFSSDRPMVGPVKLVHVNSGMQVYYGNTHVTLRVADRGELGSVSLK